MGRVFQSSQKKRDRTEGFYSKVIENCTLFLEKLILIGDEENDVTQVEIEEATEIVKHIEDYR